MRSRRRGLAATLAVVAGLAAAGCLGGRSGPAMRFWVLDALPGPPPAGGERRTLGVGPVEIPVHLDRAGIVTREGENRMKVAAFDQWGEPLARGIQRVVAENLSLLAPGLETVPFPWVGPVVPELQLALSVTRFDARRGGEVELLGSWALTRTADGSQVSAGSSFLREPVEGDGIGAVVAAMSRALADWSRQILPAVQAVPAAAAPAPAEAAD